MSIVKTEKSFVSGKIKLPSSKSIGHRALICSFLAGGGNVYSLDKSADITSTENAIRALKENADTVNCGESGSTLRFMIPLAAALGKSVTFTGSGKLPERPIGEYIPLLTSHGVNCSYSGKLPLSVNGRLKSGRFEIRGDVSSQYITGLLLALPLLDGDSEIVLTTPLESKPYADMTVDVMKTYGVSVTETKSGYTVKGNQKYKKINYTVESDWSQAAFFLAMGVIGGDVTLENMNMNSVQGDKEIVNVLRRFGGDIEIKENTLRAKKSKLRGAEIDVSDIPDTVPALAVVCAFSQGESRITGGKRLRLKESDRIESVASNLIKMGVDVIQTDDGMIIKGKKPTGAALCGFNDHRIVMAFCTAGLNADGETAIDDAESINKSYPAFFEDVKNLGGKIDVFRNR